MCSENSDAKKIKAFLMIIQDKTQPISEEARGNLLELNETLKQLSFSPEDKLLRKQEIIVDKIFAWIKQHEYREIRDRIKEQINSPSRVNLEEAAPPSTNENTKTPICEIAETINNIILIENESLLQSNSSTENTQSLTSNNESK